VKVFHLFSQIGCRRFLAYLILLALFSVLPAAVWAQSPPTISKAFGAANVPVNGSTTLTFTITNPNPATDLTNVSFTDNLPAGLIIANPDSLTPDPVLGDCDSTGTTGVITPATTSISLSGGQIPANATCTFSIDVFAISGGDQVNTTDPISSTEGGTGGTATATVTVDVSDLTIAKTHTGTFQQGQPGATYTITVTNSGSATTTNPVTVTDTLPAGLTASAIGGVGWTCSTPPTLQCSRADAIDPGVSFSDLTVTVNVAANAPPSVTNSATVSGGGEVNTSNDTATDVTAIGPAPDLTITKSHSGSFTPGQTGATYTLTVSNVGSGATNATVTVTDTLPNVPNTLVPTAISGTGWTCTLATLTCTRSDVLAAAASYPAITLVVNVPGNIAPTVTNTATVSGGGEINTANDTASDPTHIGTSPLIISAQTVNLQVSRGKSVFTVLNVDASSGVAPITFACSGLPAGASCSFTPPSGSALSFQVTMIINTTGAGGAWTFPGPGDIPGLYPILMPVFGVMMFLSWRRSKKLQVRLAFALGLLLLLAVAGCGGGGNDTRTPIGTFPVTVTATSPSTGASSSTTVNLTVL